MCVMMIIVQAVKTASIKEKNDDVTGDNNYFQIWQNREGIIICFFFTLFFAGYSVWSCGAYHELGEV